MANIMSYLKAKAGFIVPLLVSATGFLGYQLYERMTPEGRLQQLHESIDEHLVSQWEKKQDALKEMTADDKISTDELYAYGQITEFIQPLTAIDRLEEKDALTINLAENEEIPLDLALANLYVQNKSCLHLNLTATPGYGHEDMFITRKTLEQLSDTCRVYETKLHLGHVRCAFKNVDHTRSAYQQGGAVTFNVRDQLNNTLDAFCYIAGHEYAHVQQFQHGLMPDVANPEDTNSREFINKISPLERKADDVSIRLSARNVNGMVDLFMDHTRNMNRDQFDKLVEQKSFADPQDPHMPEVKRVKNAMLTGGKRL